MTIKEGYTLCNYCGTYYYRCSKYPRCCSSDPNIRKLEHRNDKINKILKK